MKIAPQTIFGAPNLHFLEQKFINSDSAVFGRLLRGNEEKFWEN